MENFNHKKSFVSARLAEIEEGTAYFVSDLNKDEIIPWPVSNLPEGIEIGDTVNIKVEALKKKAVNEAKFDDMRKMLEELVN